DQAKDPREEIPGVWWNAYGLDFQFQIVVPALDTRSAMADSGALGQHGVSADARTSAGRRSPRMRRNEIIKAKPALHNPRRREECGRLWRQLYAAPQRGLPGDLELGLQVEEVRQGEIFAQLRGEGPRRHKQLCGGDVAEDFQLPAIAPLR